MTRLAESATPQSLKPLRCKVQERMRAIRAGGQLATRLSDPCAGMVTVGQLADPYGGRGHRNLHRHAIAKYLSEWRR